MELNTKYSAPKIKKNRQNEAERWPVRSAHCTVKDL